MKVCSFCGKSQDKVSKMITCVNADICNECVLLCMSALVQRTKKELIEFQDINKREDE